MKKLNFSPKKLLLLKEEKRRLTCKKILLFLRAPAQKKNKVFLGLLSQNI